MPRNPRTTALLTISLPREMAAKVEKTRKAEQRTRSELVREALRTYFDRASRFPEVEATPAEIRALKRGRREIAAGNFVTLDQLRNEFAKLDASRRPRRGQKSAPRSRR
jgi:predicted transcriptional regulator